MWKQFLIVLTIVVVCYAQKEITSDTSRGKNPFKYHHHHGLYYLTHYWVFLAIKAKIIFLIGTFISFWVFAGKIFAYLYYYKNNKENCNCPQYHAEKIVIPETPHYEHKYSTIFNSGPYDDDYSGPTSNIFYGKKPPSNIFYGKKPPISSFERYSRSIGNSIFENIDIIKSVIKKTDVTELAFDAMSLKSNSCKRRFICEANKRAENNPLFAIGLYMFSDNGLTKYKTNKTITTIEDCISLGPHCDIT